MPQKKYLFISIAIFLFLSFVLYKSWATEKSCFDRDSVGYDQIACDFVQNNTLTDTHHPSLIPIQPIGYPFFVGLIYKVFGYNYLIVIFIQVLLSILSLYLVFSMANSLFGPQIASISAILCAINLGMLVYAQTFLTESILLLFILLSAERMVNFLKTQKNISILLSGFFLGVSILIKSSALILFFFIPPLLMFYKIPFKKRILATLLFIISFSAPVLAYMEGNRRKYEFFSIAPLKRLNMYYVFLSKVIAQKENISEKEAYSKIPFFDRQNRFDARGWDKAKKLFWQHTTETPFTCLYVWLKNVSKTLFGLFSTQMKIIVSKNFRGGDLSFFREEGDFFKRAISYITKGANSNAVKLIAFLEAFWTVFRYLMVLIAFILLIQMGEFWMAIIFAIVIASLSVITGFDGCCRYRIIFEPLLIILTAIGILASYGWLFGKKVKIHNNLP